MNIAKAVELFGAIVESFSLDDSYSVEEVKRFSQAVAKLPPLRLSEDRRMSVCRDIEFAEVSKMVVASGWELKVVTSCEAGLIASTRTDSGTFFIPIRHTELSDSLRAGGGMIDFACAMAFRVELTKLVNAYKAILDGVQEEPEAPVKRSSFVEKNAVRVANDEQFGAW